MATIKMLAPTPFPSQIVCSSGITYVPDSAGIVNVTVGGSPVGGNSDILALTLAGFIVAGVPGVRDNLTATTDPGLTNDGTAGQDYGAGSVWINATANRAWVCVSAVTNAAVWINAGGVSSTTKNNTNLTTVGSGTLLAAALLPGIVTRTGPVAAFTDTTDTAVNILAALVNPVVGQSWEVVYKNTVPFNSTIAGGTGVTLSGQTVVPPNSVLRAQFRVATSSTLTLQGLEISPLTLPPLEVSTALTTVGAGTITAAGIVGAFTARSGSTGAFTDTTDTAANIIAALPNANVGQAFEYKYQNLTAGVATIAGGTGVTVSGITAVPAGATAVFLVSYASAGVVTMVGMGALAASPTPFTQRTSISAASGVIPAANFGGGLITTLLQSGATALTTPTATALLAAIPNATVGFQYRLRIINTNGSTLTLTMDASITATGTLTLATNTFRDFDVVFTSAVAATMQSVGTGTNS